MHLGLADQTFAKQDQIVASLAASTAFNGVGVDTSGWDGAIFYFLLGVTDGTFDLKIQRDDNSGFSSATDITSAALTQVTGTGDNLTYAIDVYRPTERYLRSVMTTGAGATADVAGVLAILYRGTGTSGVGTTAATGLTQYVKVVGG